MCQSALATQDETQSTNNDPEHELLRSLIPPAPIFTWAAACNRRFARTIELPEADAFPFWYLLPSNYAR